jgi:hypothetical protein
MNQPSPREHRVRRAGNGASHNGPDDGARPWGPGSAKAESKGREGKCGGDTAQPCEQTRRTRPNRKEDGRTRDRSVLLYARSRGDPSDEPSRDAIGRKRSTELSAGGKLRRAGWRGGEVGFATDGNAANPMIGSGMKQARAVEEEQPVEVVRNHEDGTREGVATLPEGRESVREWTLRLVSMEGRSLDNPKRGNPTIRRRVARTGRCRERRHEGQEGRALPYESSGTRTDRGSLGGPDAQASEGRGGRW